MLIGVRTLYKLIWKFNFFFISAGDFVMVMILTVPSEKSILQNTAAVGNIWHKKLTV